MLNDDAEDRPASDVPNSTERAVLEYVVKANIEKDGAVYGRVVRVKLASAIGKDAAARALETLTPRYLRMDGTSPDDMYTATLDGLLESSHAERVRVILSGF